MLLFLIDWVILTLSLFNTILLLWLGLTVLLTAERRDWGVFMTGGGMLLGAAFFVSHTVILGDERIFYSPQINIWWRFGWIPVVLAPLAWYVLMLWYAGYWRDRQFILPGRKRLAFGVVTLVGLGLTASLFSANSLPSFQEISTLNLESVYSIRGFSVLLVVYPIYIVTCLILALDALWKPAPPDRVMGDLARQRTRPWLVAISVLLLIVSLLVSGLIFWLQIQDRGTLTPTDFLVMFATVVFLDIVISFLIAVVIVLLGQAIVSYEVFTGKTLPRRGFFRQWRNAVILAAGYGIVVAGALSISLISIYIIMLTTIMMTAFYALFSWRSFAERDHFMARLRPFVTGDGLMQQIITANISPVTGVRRVFTALCRDILSARHAYLIPLGTLAPLAGPPISYPDGEDLPASLHQIGRLFSVRSIDWIRLDPAVYERAVWAIPLWTERGIAGALLLGEKQDGGLYTQEEFEIAQASGERLIDMLAGEEIARRLVDLQRERMRQTQMVDRRARRVLHDDILPQLHTAILLLSGSPGDEQTAREAVITLSEAHHQISELIHDLPGKPSALPGNRPLLAALHLLIEDEFEDEFETIVWQGNDTLPEIDPLRKEVLFYAIREAIRNAALHGRGDQPDRRLKLVITAENNTEGIVITVEDNGVGMGYRQPRTVEHGGSGHGLALHSTMLMISGGSLTVENPAAGGTRVRFSLLAG